MVQELLLRLILYVAVAVSVFVVTWSGMRPLVRALPEVLQWGSAAAVALPFLFLISRTLERLMQHITAALLQRRADETSDQTQLVRNTLRFLFGWVAAVF